MSDVAVIAPQDLDADSLWAAVEEAAARHRETPAGAEHERACNELIDALMDLAPFVADAPTAISTRTRALARRHGFVAIENTIARSPVSLTVVGKPAKPAHKEITMLLAKGYAENAAAGHPNQGWVELSLAEIADMLYPSTKRGGWQYERIRNLLQDLCGALVTEEWLVQDTRTDRWFTIAQGGVMTSADGGRAAVQLTEPMQRSILENHWTYVEREAVRRLRLASPRSDGPELLYLWLVTERLPFKWKVFADPDAETSKGAGRRSVAARLNMPGKKKRDVVAAIRKAAKVVCATFPEYTITVEPGKSRGTWNLCANRRQVVGSLAEESSNHHDSGVREPDGPVYEDGTDAVYESRTDAVENDPAKPLLTIEDNDDLVSPPPSCSSPSSFSRREKRQTGILANPGDEGMGFANGSNHGPQKLEECGPWELTELLYCRNRDDEECATENLVTEASQQTFVGLARLACDTARRESRGAICEFAAIDRWCPVWDALGHKGLKINNYLRRKKQAVDDSDAYMRGVLANARRDPVDALGGQTRREAVELLAHLRRLPALRASDPAFESPEWGWCGA
jgi:hypothetical protein